MPKSALFSSVSASKKKGWPKSTASSNTSGGGVKEFNKLDASIIALKRKAEVCNEKALYGDAIPAAQHMLDLLDDYEQHHDDYHDGSIREPADEERPFYIDFYRGKAYAYLAVPAKK